MKRLSILLGVVLSISMAAASDVTVTIYNQNIGLVKETREIPLQRGIFSYEAADVAAMMDPTSVHLKLDGAAILDQNFEYDLVSRDRLLERYLDQPIKVFTEGGEFFEGTLLSTSGSQLILQAPDGQVQIISPDAVRDIRFGELPGGLRTRPTLVWTLDGSRSGKTNAELSYMTGGMDWHTEYVAVTAEKSKTLELSSWVSIENHSGTTFHEAKLKLMAGDVRVSRGGRPDFYAVQEVPIVTMDAKSAPAFEEKPFSDYHLYTLQRPVTIKDRQTKQISLFDPVDVAATREYVYDAQRGNEKIMINLVFQNEKQGGLGIPLPAGKVRVYQADEDGGLEFVGEDRIAHTPKDEEVRLVIGSAFDVKAEKVVLESKRLSDRVREELFQVKVRNHKDEMIKVKVIEHQWGDWEILHASHDYTTKDANTIEFNVPVAAGKETVVVYRVRRQ